MYGDKADAMNDRSIDGWLASINGKNWKFPKRRMRVALLSRLHQRCSGRLFSGAEAFLDKPLRAGICYEIEAWSER
jgi:hypothetical protein